MNIDTMMTIDRVPLTHDRKEELRKEATAVKFEELFARHLVKEMTKNIFKMSDNMAGVSQAGSMYQEFITDALASQMAAQRKLGMADLIMKYWTQEQQEPPNLNTQKNEP